jgi:hypothetical protein
VAEQHVLPFSVQVVTPPTEQRLQAPAPVSDYASRWALLLAFATLDARLEPWRNADPRGFGLALAQARELVRSGNVERWAAPPEATAQHVEPAAASTEHTPIESGPEQRGEHVEAVQLVDPACDDGEHVDHGDVGQVEAAQHVEPAAASAEHTPIESGPEQRCEHVEAAQHPGEHVEAAQLVDPARDDGEHVDHGDVGQVEAAQHPGEHVEAAQLVEPAAASAEHTPIESGPEQRCEHVEAAQHVDPACDDGEHVDHGDVGQVEAAQHPGEHVEPAADAPSRCEWCDAIPGEPHSRYCPEVPEHVGQVEAAQHPGEHAELAAAAEPEHINAAEPIEPAAQVVEQRGDVGQVEAEQHHGPEVEAHVPVREASAEPAPIEPGPEQHDGQVREDGERVEPSRDKAKRAASTTGAAPARKRGARKKPQHRTAEDVDGLRAGLAAARKAGTSQRALAVALEVSQSQISRFEAGKGLAEEGRKRLAAWLTEKGF